MTDLVQAGQFGDRPITEFVPVVDADRPHRRGAHVPSDLVLVAGERVALGVGADQDGGVRDHPEAGEPGGQGVLGRGGVGGDLRGGIDHPADRVGVGERQDPGGIAVL
ncbi:hypothetical protein GCM10025331_55990 [Actinoplanes utahensis]|nr:hypothetical protein [Actinoplanes utahensis]GIF33371.1 hypothetical protein Aut01nite_63570 [Actinoplanes utahensis]